MKFVLRKSRPLPLLPSPNVEGTGVGLKGSGVGLGAECSGDFDLLPSLSGEGSGVGLLGGSQRKLGPNLNKPQKPHQC